MRRSLAIVLACAGSLILAGCGPVVVLAVAGAAGAAGASGGGGGGHGGGGGGGPGTPPPGAPVPPLAPAPPLVAPSGLSASAVSATRVDLRWTDNATGEFGFRVERRVRGTGSFLQLGTAPPDATTYVDQAGSPGTDYDYRVLATGPFGESVPSNTAEATTWLAVAGISPSAGPIAGGTSVSISGAGFRAGATVSIAGTPLVNVVVQSATTISGVTSATIAVGPCDVVVSGPNGSGVLTGAFNYRLGLAAVGSAVALGGPGSDVVAGDFNEDGKLDLAYVTRGAFIGVLLGDGAGAFPTLVSTAASGRNLFGIAASDLNGDGHLDLVASDLDHDAVVVYHGDGTGKFTAVSSISSVGPYPERLRLGDLNEDHAMDAVVPLFGSGLGGTPSNVRFLLGNGSGQLVSPGTDVAVLSGPQNVAIVDEDQDGHLDVFTTNHQSSSLSLLRGKGDGTFDTPVAIPVTIQNSDLAVGDFKRSGRPQVFVAHQGAAPVVVGRDQAGSFVSTTLRTTLVGHRVCVVVDLNRDGYPDVVATAAQDQQHSVFLNDRKGGFVEYLIAGPACGPTGTAFGALAAGDFDRDGRLDIALASPVDNTVTIYLNR